MRRAREMCARASRVQAGGGTTGEQGMTPCVLMQFTGEPLMVLSQILTSSSPFVACTTNPPN